MSRFRSILTISLDDEQDQDVKQWLASLQRGQRSAIVRDALRRYQGLGIEQVTLYDVLQAIKRLEHRLDQIEHTLQQGVRLAHLSDTSLIEETEEDNDIASNIDNLGL